MQTTTSTPPNINPSLPTYRRRLASLLLDRYLSSLVRALCAVPIGAAFITVGIYILLPGWHAILLGCIVTCALWLFISIPLGHFVSASGANRRSYDQLISQLAQLKTRLEALKEQQKQSDNKPLSMCSQIALKEVEACYTTLEKSLTSSGDLRWVSGIGYLDAWETLHQAQEALIEVEPVNMVLDDVLYDKRCIQNSTIGNSDELLTQLVQAIKDLDPDALIYFKEHQPPKVNVDLQGAIQQQTRGIAQIAQALKTVHPDVAIDV